MRDIRKVIAAIVGEIPSGGGGWFVTQLEDIAHNSAYLAPETSAVAWNELSALLRNELSCPPQADFERRIDAIMSDWANPAYRVDGEGR